MSSVLEDACPVFLPIAPPPQKTATPATPPENPFGASALAARSSERASRSRAAQARGNHLATSLPGGDALAPATAAPRHSAGGESSVSV